MDFENKESVLNAFELDRAELAVTQQMLKVVLNDIIQSANNPRQTRETISTLTDTLLENYEIQGFGPDKTDAVREYMRHHATIIMSQVGNTI